MVAGFAAGHVGGDARGVIFVPNKLGSTNFGTLAYAVAYVQIFTLIGGLGTSVYLARAIARDASITGRYVWNAVLLKLGLWVVLSTAALALAYALGNRGLTLRLIAIACAGMLPYLLIEVFTASLTGMQRMAGPALWTVLQVYFQTVFGVLVLALGGGVVAFMIVQVLGSVIPFAATGLMVRPFVRGHRVFDLHVWRLLIVGGTPLLALNFLTMVYGSIDVPILHAFVGSEPVGWYAVALRWVGVPIFITYAVAMAYFPAFSMHGKPLTREFAPLVNRAIRVVLLVTIPAAIGLIFIADDLVAFIYNREFDSSIVLIQILAVGLPIIAIDTLLGMALVAADRVKGFLGVAAIAAVLNPIACIVLIPIADSRYDNGAIAAAIVTVATELWIMAGALYFRSPGVVDRTEVRQIGRIVAASAAMAPVLLVSAGWPLAVQVVLGMVVYALASLALRSITLAELRDEVGRMTRARGRAGPSGSVHARGEGDAHTIDDETSAELGSLLPNGEMHTPSAHRP